MAGIDYTKAGVEEREAFSFTAAARDAALKLIHERYAGTECVIIATCNRTELWLYAESGVCPNPDKLLCELKNLSFERHKSFFVNRAGRGAAEYLFSLAAGLESQIMGENQILSQVKEAIEAARAAGSAFAVLQRLFQSAISSAKRIKTETGIMRADVSIASAALDFIRSRGFNLRNATCLVIGNGVIGRLCAELFSNAGADVTVTLRQHKHGKTVLTKNVRIIDYDERYLFLSDCQIVISATVSPHHTITYTEASHHLDNAPRIFLDLAVPRDIDPLIKNINGVQLFDIDEINKQKEPECIDFDKIKKIIDEELSAFKEWYVFRANIETIMAIKNEFSADLARRIGAEIKAASRDSLSEERLSHAVTSAAGRILDKLLFGLRDNLDEELWADCFAALYKSALSGTNATENVREMA
jgi:glutamyl-tRNA reductase